MAVGITDCAPPGWYYGQWLELAIVADIEVAYRGPFKSSNGQCLMQLKNSMYFFWDVQQHASFRGLSSSPHAQIGLHILFCFYCVYSFILD